jgi:uncharacterized membrane protein SpoIIM required for sporulation
MRSLQLKSQKFRQEREADWRRLGFLLEKMENQGAGSLTENQLMEMPVLYRSALSSLSVARATSLDQSLIDYLEGLCARAYFLVYGVRGRILERIGGFFARGWPNAVLSLWKETLVAVLITLASAVVGYLLVLHSPEWFYGIVDGGLSEGRDPAASAESLRKTLYHDGGNEGLSIFAAFLFTHNAQVALMAFALGFAFCVPTALLLMQNGVMLGAFVAVFASKGLGFEFAGWLMIHGVTEIFAITIAGAAGFRIGLAVGFPGDRTRLEAASTAGRTAGVAMMGVVVMLFVAGLLEGIGRQVITTEVARYAIGIGSGLVWIAFYYLPRPGRAAHVRA